MGNTKMLTKWPKNITASHVEKLIRAEKDVNKALLVFDSATAEYANGFRHDHSTFSLMISKMVSANQFVSAEQLLTRMKEEQCDVMEDVFLSICRGYGRVHRPLDAMRVFKKMEDFRCTPSIKAYVTIFNILVEENHLKMALQLYRYMRRIGISPNVASLNVLIKALCKDSGTIDSALKIFREMPTRGYDPDSYTYGTLINGLCRLGKINDAKVLFREMEEKGCSPSVVTYSSLIHGLCQSGNLDQAFGLFEEMVTKGVVPNVFTYGSLMDGFCKSGCSSQAIELLDKMLSQQVRPNRITYSTLIDGLCREGKVSEASGYLDRMKLQGLKPDAGLYGKVISGYCDIGKFREAANFIDEMILERISPNRLTRSIHVRIHNKVIQGLCTCNELNRAYQLYRSMRARGISVEVSSFNLLVRCFCTKGDLQKAARVFDEMVLDGYIPDEWIWCEIMSEFWDQREVQEAGEFLEELLNEVATSET